MPTSSTPAELAAFAEAPDAHTVPAPGFRPVLDERFCLLLGPTPRFTNVSRVRAASDDLDALLADVRDIVRDAGHVATRWSIGPSTEPPDLYDRLRARGFGFPHFRELTALVLDDEPPATPSGVHVRPLATLEEYAEASAIVWEAFETPEDEGEARRRRLADLFYAERQANVARTYLAAIDGRPAAAAVFAPSGVLLAAGATRPWARGRGAYRALVRARWSDAVGRGTPALVTQAGPMSEPILRRLGFREVCRLRRLVDSAG